MPVDFLSPEQQRNYGRYTADPSPAQLDRYFFLDDTDRNAIAACRGSHNRLGFAVQLGTVRFLGTFLSDPTEVPPTVVRHLVRQLDLADTSCLTRYRDSETRWDHTTEIQRQYGYRSFHDPSESFRLVRWLYTRAWISAERPSVLFDLATARLVERKVLLPGVTVLARLVARVRDQTATRLWQRLAALPSVEQSTRLEALLEVPEDTRQSALDRLRQAPTRVSGPALVEALHRLTEIRALGVGTLDVSRIPPGRLQVLARYAAAACAQAIARMPEERRRATLLAFAQAFEISALDDALDLLDLVVTDLFKDAQKSGQKERLQTLRRLDTAALQLREACALLLDDTYDDAHVRAIIFARISRERLLQAADTIEALARPPDDNYYAERVERYRRVRRFLPSLLRTISLDSVPAGRPLIEAVHFLADIEGQRAPDMKSAPREMLTGAWRRRVLDTEDRWIDARIRSARWNDCRMDCAGAMCLSPKAHFWQLYNRLILKVFNGSSGVDFERIPLRTPFAFGGSISQYANRMI